MKGRIPSGWGRDKLSDFIENANQNTIATFANLRPIFKKLQDIDGAFRKIVDNLDNTREWFEGLFLLRAHSSYLGAVRLSTSGQVPETYMVLRGCIENSLYGLYLHKKPEEREIWLKRHDDDESKRRVRRKFKITSMLDLLESSHASTSRVARELYEDTIDYGAHPNERTITSALRMKKEERVIRFDLTVYLETHQCCVHA